MPKHQSNITFMEFPVSEEPCSHPLAHGQAEREGQKGEEAKAEDARKKVEGASQQF